ncbi:MAG: OmpA family protein [Nitrospirota bacterium]
MALYSGIAGLIRATASRITRGAAHPVRPAAGRSAVPGEHAVHTSRGGRSAAGYTGQPIPVPACSFDVRHHTAACIIFLASFIVLFAAASGMAATPAGTVISNTARASFTDGITPTIITASSNTVDVVTVALRTSAVLELMHYAPAAPGAQPVPVALSSYSTSGTAAGPFAPLAPPVAAGGALISLAGPVPLVPAAQYHAGEPVFIRLTDPDQDLDPAVVETVIVTLRDNVTGDTEVIRLAETGPNTGAFTGYVQTDGQPPASGSGVLNVVDNSRVDAGYTDAADAADARTLGVLVDPFGMVFNSATGQPVDGATVTLMNAATNLPATVYGDDGISIFPAAVTSGGTAADSGGKTYTFSPGGYRFPFIAPGTYRIEVVPPAGYRAPSTVTTADLQTLPGGPFAITEPGSRAENFIVNPGPAIHIDVPVDPAGSRLYLTKTAGKQVAAIGDFVPYRLAVENTDALFPVLSVVVEDRLPAGFRYRSGSSRVNGAAASDPAVSADGRTLSFRLGAVAAGSTVTVGYVAEVGAGARPGKARNTAAASGAGGAVSNAAIAEVVVAEDLFRSTATIVGQIVVDGCGDRERSEQAKLEGIRIFREDGVFAVTDRNGMYHFPAVKPGTHAVQLDTLTVPERYEVMACEENTRFAGSAASQFVDLQGGTLWRADFHLGLRPKQIGEVGIEITTAPKGLMKAPPAAGSASDLVEYSVLVHVGIVPARNLKLTIMLPEGGVYQPGSASFSASAKQADGTVSAPTGSIPAPIAISEPLIADGSVTFRFGELPANSEGTLRFDVAVQLSGAAGKQLTTGAMLTSDSPESRNNRTPVVNSTLVIGTRDELRPAPDIVLHPRFPSGSTDLTARDKAELDRLIAQLKKKRVEHITVTGHTDSRPIRTRMQSRFPDNYALSYERAAVIGAYLADGLDLTHDQLTYEGRGPDEPAASNATEQGRSENRRVELRIKPAMEVVAVPALKGGQPSGMKAVAVVGLRPGEVWPREKQAGDRQSAKQSSMPEYNAAWIAEAAPGLELL